MGGGREPGPWGGDLFRPVRLDAETTGTLATRGVWGIVGTASQGGLRFLANMLVGRIAGPVALGVFAGAVSVALLLSLLWPTSIGSAASKFLARSRGAGDLEETRAVAGHLGRRNRQATLLLALVAAGWWWFHESGATAIDLVSIAALMIGYSGYAFTRGVQYGVGQVRRGTQWDVVSAGLGVAGLLVLLAIGVRSLALLLPLAASYGLYTLACWPHGTSGRLRERGLRREIDVFITLAAIGSVVSSGFVQLAMIVAKSAVDPHEAGLFAAALTLATPASLLAGSLSLVLFPTMAETWGRGRLDQFRLQTDLATRGLVTVMVAIFGSLALCSRTLVLVLWGEEYAEAAQVLPILLGAVCFTTMAVSSVNAIMTVGRRGMVVTTGGGVAGVLAGVLIWWATVGEWGITGIAVGYLAGTLISFTIAYTLCWRQNGQRWGLLTLRLVLAAVALGLTVFWSAAQTWGFLGQLASAAAFVGLWAIASLPDVRGVLAHRRR